MEFLSVCCLVDLCREGERMPSSLAGVLQNAISSVWVRYVRVSDPCWFFINDSRNFSLCGKCEQRLVSFL